jgi:hypothetical protein
MKKKQLFHLLILVFGIAGCQKKSGSDSSLDPLNDGALPSVLSDIETHTDVVTLIPRIDASTLKIFNLKVGNYENQGSLQEVLSFSADPRSAYIQYKICPLETTQQECPKTRICAKGGECKEQATMFDRVLFSYIGGGKTKVSAQACIDAQRALTDVTCGPVEEIFYDSARYEGQIADLLSTREHVFSQYKNSALEMRAILDTFMRDATNDLANKEKGCLQNNLDAYNALKAKTAAVYMYLQAPIDVTMDILRNNTGGVGAASLDSLGVTLKVMNKGLAQFCQDMAAVTKSNKTCIVLKAIAGVALQFAYMMLPQTMLTNLVTAIEDIKDPSTPRRCTAEDIFNQKFQAINQLQQALYVQLQQVNDQLKTFGY